MFPKPPSENGVRLNMDGVFALRSFGDERRDGPVSGRIGVDSWVDAGRGSRSGRLSEMV